MSDSQPPSPSLSSLPTEIFLQILLYLSPPSHPINPPAHLSSLRLTCRALYSIITPLYWLRYVPQIEAWGFDLLEDEHPTFATPKPSIVPRASLTRKLKDKLRILGGDKYIEEKKKKYSEEEKGLEWTENEIWCYRVGEDGRARLRNLGWLKKMPNDARKLITSVWIYGPVPEQARDTIGPPPRACDRDPADFWAPLYAVMRWLRINLPDLENITWVWNSGTSFVIQALPPGAPTDAGPFMANPLLHHFPFPSHKIRSEVLPHITNLVIAHRPSWSQSYLPMFRRLITRDQNLNRVNPESASLPTSPCDLKLAEVQFWVHEPLVSVPKEHNQRPAFWAGRDEKREFKRELDSWRAMIGEGGLENVSVWVMPEEDYEEYRKPFYRVESRLEKAPKELERDRSVREE